MIYLLVFLIGYLIGSFPTAYLLVKWKFRIDIRNEGTGNVGGLNSYEVTKSKAVGLTVLVLDLLKGAMAVVLVGFVFGNVFVHSALATLGAVAGHNFSVWIGFKGGRGLATAAGAMLLINPLVVAVWIVLWVIVFIPVRNVHWGNILATVVTPFILMLFPHWSLTLTRGEDIEPYQFFLFGFILCGIIFLKHIKPLTVLLRECELKRNLDEKSSREAGSS